MAEKGKSRSAGARSKQDKSRAPARAQPRQSKKPSPKTSRRSPSQPSPSPDEESVPREPLDVGPILDELLDRVLTEYALAVAARQRVPFTVSRARDAILFVAEWRFPVRDDGDPDRGGDPDPERDGVWSEDEEPQTCAWDSWAPGVVPVADASVPAEEISPEDVSAIGEAESPGEVPDAVPVVDVPLSPGEVPAATPPFQSPSAAAAAPPAQVPGADIVVPVPEPPRPELPSAPRTPGRGRIVTRSPGRGRIVTRAPGRGHIVTRSPGRGRIVTRPPGRGDIVSRPPGRGDIVTRPPGRGSRLSRSPLPPPAPLDEPQPQAPLPAAPSEPPAQAPQESREGEAKVGHQVPPPPLSSRSSVASIQPRRPSRGTGMPRLGARRGAARWVLPEVKVVDVTTEPERARPGASRSRVAPPWSLQVAPGAGRVPKGEPQLCDPWLASARLAPGVTVRWGGSVRRGPAPAGYGGHGSGELEDEAVRRAEELEPILPYPLCRISEYGD